MSKVISNQRLSNEFYLMKVEHSGDVRMGQFYMLRAWGDYPVLSRPLSVFDADGHSVSFFYKVVGKGTEIFAALQAGADIDQQGPWGNTFPVVSGQIALIGRGVGIAPLYLAAKQLRAASPNTAIHIYLGFKREAVLVEEFCRVADRVKVNVGGYITDDISPEAYDHILTCGPEKMMRTLYDKCEKAGVANRLIVSTESRMACGIGACLVCNCKTKSGNKKVCKDGPIFSGEEVFGYE
ncbi:MAG: dihydroorotate dehydrogenase electron transfer subunit [Treponema sp.]|nr:dihydroorotate dehydrogenase electron transfer subunit [Treponema sp.]